MTNGVGRIVGRVDVWFDFLPNQPRTPEGRAVLEDFIRRRFDAQVAAAVDRIHQLPAVMVHAPGEYVALLAEAREVYSHGHYCACAAMCGIVGERILKDVLRQGLRVAAPDGIRRPTEEALDQLERVDVGAIARFLVRAGLVTEEAGKAADKLQQLRNTYAHARGRNPEADALDAIAHLHGLIEGSVSVFTTHEIKDGKLVPKAASPKTP